MLLDHVVVAADKSYVVIVRFLCFTWGVSRCGMGCFVGDAVGEEHAGKLVIGLILRENGGVSVSLIG